MYCIKKPFTINDSLLKDCTIQDKYFYAPFGNICYRVTYNGN